MAGNNVGERWRNGLRRNGGGEEDRYPGAPDETLKVSNTKIAAPNGPTPLALGLSYIRRLTSSEFVDEFRTVDNRTMFRDIAFYYPDVNQLKIRLRNLNGNNQRPLSGFLFVTGYLPAGSKIYNIIRALNALLLGSEQEKIIDWERSSINGCSQFVSRGWASFALNQNDYNASLAAEKNNLNTLTFQCESTKHSKEFSYYTITTKKFSDLKFLFFKIWPYTIPRRVYQELMRQENSPKVHPTPQNTLVFLLGLKSYEFDRALIHLAAHIIDDNRILVYFCFDLMRDVTKAMFGRGASVDAIRKQLTFINDENEWKARVRDFTKDVELADEAPERILRNNEKAWTFAISPVMGYSWKRFDRPNERRHRSQSRNPDKYKIGCLPCPKIRRRVSSAPPNPSFDDGIGPFRLIELFEKQVRNQFERITFSVPNSEDGIQVTAQGHQTKKLIAEADNIRRQFKLAYLHVTKGKSGHNSLLRPNSLK